MKKKIPRSIRTRLDTAIQQEIAKHQPKLWVADDLNWVFDNLD